MNPAFCTIIAGPNGAGKTIFSLKYLAEDAQCENFVNADLIASGLWHSSADPEVIFTETGDGRVIENEQLYAALQRTLTND